MNKVIDGKLYDTETATFICGYKKFSNLSSLEYDHRQGDLFVTPNGAFFKVSVWECKVKEHRTGTRGVPSGYTTMPENVDPTVLKKTDFEICSEEKALGFVKAYGSGDQILKYFPDVVIEKA